MRTALRATVITTSLIVAAFAGIATEAYAKPTVDTRLENIENKISVTPNQNGYGSPVSLTTIATSNTTNVQLNGVVEVSGSHVTSNIASPIAGTVTEINLSPPAGMAGTSTVVTPTINGTAMAVSDTLTITSGTTTAVSSSITASNTVAAGDLIGFQVGAGLTSVSSTGAIETRINATVTIQPD